MISLKLFARPQSSRAPLRRGLVVRPVQSPAEMIAFIKLPWMVNADDPYWVPPLIQDRKKLLDASKNPFFKHNPAELFLAYQDGRPAGRIAAMVNRQHNQLHGDQTGFFGFFDAVNDGEVFAGLLDAAEQWLRGMRCDAIVGPVSPDTNNELGFLIDGFDSPPYFMLAHNPPYYNALLESLGYAKARDFYSYIVSRETFVDGEKLRRVNKRVLKRYPVKLRAGNIKQLQSELEIIGQIYNDAFSHHWGFVPMTSDDIRYFADDLRQIVDPELVLIAEYDGEPAGFLLALPNINEVLIKIRDGRLFPFGWLTFMLNKSKIRGVRVLTIGIKQKYEAFGFGSLFYEEIAKRVMDRGYLHLEMSWVIEDNLMMNRAARLLGGKVYKTYRMYRKAL